MNLRKMMRMLRAMCLEDLEMEVDRIELKALEMMDLEDSYDYFENISDYDGGEARKTLSLSSSAYDNTMPQTLIFLGDSDDRRAGTKRKRESGGDYCMNKKRRDDGAL